MNKILEATRYVVENSGLVKINCDKVTEFAKRFNSNNNAKHWLSTALFNFFHFSDEDKLNFLFIFSALNFSYWGDPKWTVEYKHKKHDGSLGMILALERGIDEGISLTNFKYCSEISRKEFAHILRGSTEIPLFKERWDSLCEMGENIIANFDGNAGNLIKKANNDAQKLVELIVLSFPSFSDTSMYKGEEIYFYKRAQLLVADIFQLFGGKGYGALKNIDQITACADYKLPLILRNLGILEYLPVLAKKIDNKKEIEKGSIEEIEIRAGTIWAVEFIKEDVKKNNPQVMSFQINDNLWLAAQGNNDNKFYHRTRTTAY